MIETLLSSSFIMSILAFALILIPAIIIHELGHFFAAKKIGVNVLEFGIGYPPRAARLFMWGETEFTINWLPLGGFVRPLGEDMLGPIADYSEFDEYDDLYDDEKPKKNAYMSEREELMARGVHEADLLSVNEAKPLPRIFFMAAGAMANVSSAIILLMITALLGIPIEVGARVQLYEIPAGSVFEHPEVKPLDAIERINGEFFRTSADFFVMWDGFSGESVSLTLRHPDDEDGTAGEQYEIMATVPQTTGLSGSILITAIVEDSPAHTAGLLPGDLIRAVDGVLIAPQNPVRQLQLATQAAAGKGVTLTVQRGSEQVDIFVIPRIDPPPGQGRVGIGIKAVYQTPDGVQFMDTDSQYEIIPQSPQFAVQYGFQRTWSTLKLMASIPSKIIDGTISAKEARPVSIIGISQIGGQFLQRSIRQGTPSMILDFIALVSIFLGVSNLLPLPPLDGGRILFVLIEMLRGKPVSSRIENQVNRIGIVLLLSLTVVIIIYDIINPFVIP